MICQACNSNETEGPEFIACRECLNDACHAEEVIDLDELEEYALRRAERCSSTE